jgi:hypothetical protein
MKQKITDEQLKEELDLGKTNQEIANEYGLDVRNIYRRKAKLARQGWSPEHDMTKEVPDGYHIKGTSTLYGPEGRQKLQWVKTNIDWDRQYELMQEAIIAMREEIDPIDTYPRSTTHETAEHLLNCYVITDYHLGMMAWHEEAGEDWDLHIAEELIYKWFQKAIEQAPNAKTGVFTQLGDFMHWDGMEAVTPMNKHVVDADTRFQKLVRVAIRVIRRIIAMLLEKHDQVILIQPGGNHDIASTPWLCELFHALYEEHDRVTVDRNADLYSCYEHGLTSLFFHHGHKRKVTNIDDVFVAKYREVFGRTKYSYAHLGHLHSVDVKETNLMIVERHRTLAAPDAYASGGGWMSGRDAKVITYHEQYGEVSRLTLSPEMLR